jgi:tRNA 2-thiouridine synthesizing protein A
MTSSAHESLTATDTLDCTGLLCPLPVYKTALALRKLQAGEVLKLICTDPGSLEDIPAMARQRGDSLLASRVDGTTQTFWIEKGETT